MSKRKCSFQVDKVLPGDNTLGQRENIWYGLLEKYNKFDDTREFSMDQALDGLDRECSEESDVSDVPSCGDDDSDQENREELSKQLAVVVRNRKRDWKRSGLFTLIEEQPFNTLSHEKVENWLNNRLHTGGPGVTRQVVQDRETIVKQLNESGGELSLHHRTHRMHSTKDDEESLVSVDTAQYIKSNAQRKGGNVNFQKVKTVTTIQMKTTTTMTTKCFGSPPRLHSTSSLPAIAEERTGAGGWFSSFARSPIGRPISKSDSTYERMESKASSKFIPARGSPPPLPTVNRKKTFKKKSSPAVAAAAAKKSPKSSNTNSNDEKVERNMGRARKAWRSRLQKKLVPAEQLEEAIANCSGPVRKIPLIRGRPRKTVVAERKCSSKSTAKRHLRSSEDDDSNDGDESDDETWNPSSRLASPPEKAKESSDDVFHEQKSFRSRTPERGNNSSSSSSVSNSPAKGKRILRPRTHVQFAMSDSETDLDSFRTKKTRSPRKRPSPEKELIEPFKGISLSSPKKPTKKGTARPQTAHASSSKDGSSSKHMAAAQKSGCKQLPVPVEPVQGDQSMGCNLTSLFSANNDKITNSTALSSTRSGATAHRGYKRAARKKVGKSLSLARSLVIYEPKRIDPNLAQCVRITLTASDLDLTVLPKEHQRARFVNYKCSIHPNSKLRFLLSESEEDDDFRSIAANEDGNEADTSDSCDDDPITTMCFFDQTKPMVVEDVHN